MKKILTIILFALSFCCAHAQFKDFTNPYRVIIVSPNYQNVYPRFSTLQNGYNAVKDSARAHKNFVINVTTSYNNITDWTSGYKDSILNLDPYLKLVAFGSAI